MALSFRWILLNSIGRLKNLDFYAMMKERKCDKLLILEKRTSCLRPTVNLMICFVERKLCKRHDCFRVARKSLIKSLLHKF